MLSLRASAAAALHCIALLIASASRGTLTAFGGVRAQHRGAKQQKKIIWCQERSCSVGHGGVATQAEMPPRGLGTELCHMPALVPALGGGTAQGCVEMVNPSLLAEGRYLCPLPWAGGGNSPSLVLTDVTTCLAKRARLQKRRVLSIFASQWHHEAPAKSKPNTLCWISCTGWPQLCIENRERQQRRGKFLFQGH